MERPVKQLRTNSGVNYEVVVFVTGSEGRSLGFMAVGAKTVEDQEKLHDMMISVCVKSVNGEKNNILQLVKDLPLKDYTEIVNALADLFVGLDDQKKTT